TQRTVLDWRVPVPFVAGGLAPQLDREQLHGRDGDVVNGRRASPFHPGGEGTNLLAIPANGLGTLALRLVVIGKERDGVTDGQLRLGHDGSPASGVPASHCALSWGPVLETAGQHIQCRLT